jgi:anti-sigma regulatory factor (Ser/Thr protein kinase)
VPCAATHEEAQFEPSGVAPSQARRLVRRTVGELVPEDVVDTAELLVSELVTNAVVHGSGIIVVVIDCADDQVSISVSDDEPAEPEIQPERPLALGGRGLRMIESLASAWGVRPRPDGPGKVVWVTLP